MSTFTIIVPIFNEKDNLSRLESELMKFINSTKFKTKVLIINDGSTDGSKNIIEKLCNNNSCFESISFVRNCGLSSALKAGFDLCNSEYIGYIDADLQTSPSDFHVLLKFIDNYDLVTGYRSNRKDSYLKNISSLVANGIRNIFTSDGIMLTQSRKTRNVSSFSKISNTNFQLKIQNLVFLPNKFAGLL